MITKQRTWVRLAGNAQKVRAGDPHGWRCFFIKSPSQKQANGEIPLIHWETTGEATRENMIAGIYQNAQKTDSVLAWIDFFGDVEIGDDENLRIFLKNPEVTKV